MATTSAPNHRASLLAGLRTGGVRSASASMNNVPYTAAPGATFQVPRFTAPAYNDSLYTQEEEDELSDMVSQTLYIKQQQQQQYSNRMHQPMTAAVDGSANRFAQQQNMGGYANHMSPFMTPTPQAVQQMQLQMMQVEIARLQAIQAQQYQAELLAQVQRQRQPQQPIRRSSVGFVPPASAGPTNGSFELRSTTLNSQLRRPLHADQLRAKLGVVGEEQVPMTAALGGRFGSRMGSGSYESDEEDPIHFARNPPPTPSYTTVISGGTSLGSLSSNNTNSSHILAPSKSDAAVSWRRGGQSNSVLNGNHRMASAPVVKITPPPSERVSPPPAVSPLRSRPTPLRFTAAASEPLASVAIVTGDGYDGDDSSSVSSRSNSSPSTPRSASSADMPPPLSPREEASKKLYEGLGIGRPAPAITVIAPPLVTKPGSQAVRQPRGPPSNLDELVPKNFASRSRRKAIGALGALLDARERREVEAF